MLTSSQTTTRYAPGLYRAEVTGQYGGYDNRVYPYLNQPDGLAGRCAAVLSPPPARCVRRGAACSCGRWAGGRSTCRATRNTRSARAASAHAACLPYSTSTTRTDCASRRRGRAVRSTDDGAGLGGGAHTDWLRVLRAAQRGRIAVLADAMTIGRSPTHDAYRVPSSRSWSANGGTLATLFAAGRRAPGGRRPMAVYGKTASTGLPS